MKLRLLFLFSVLLSVCISAFAQDDYYRKKAESYTREAAYCTKKGKIDNARTYTRYADSAMDNYKTQMRYASQADEKATQYLRWAADALNKL